MDSPTLTSSSHDRLQAAAAALSPGPGDSEGLRRWLDELTGPPVEVVAHLDAWLMALQGRGLPADLTLELMEIWRPAHLAHAEAVIKGLGQLPFPMPANSWLVVNRLLDSLQRAQAAYRQLYIQLTEVSGADTHMVIPGTVHSLRSVIPLARAMEYVARALRLRMFFKIHTEDTRWVEFAVMAQHMRISTFMDAVLPGAPLLLKDNTARATFVYPLLLRLANLNGLGSDEVNHVDRLARRWAGKVGFRIDEDGKIHENPHGPTVVLNGEVSVRLDTHRLDRRLRELTSEIPPVSASSGSPAARSSVSNPPPAIAQMLMPKWCGRALPRRWVPSEHGAVRIRFGLPPAAKTTAEPSTDILLAPGAASMAYVYGRFEHNTIMKMVLGSEHTDVDPAEHYLAQGDGGTWVLSSGHEAWIERYGGQAIGLGSIAAIRGTKQQKKPLRLGLVRYLEQAPPAPGDSLRKQTLHIWLWPGDANLVGLRMADESFFSDCFEITEDAVYGPTLVSAPARVRSSNMATLRLPRDDVRIEFLEVVERGPGWQRTRYRCL